MFDIPRERFSGVVVVVVKNEGGIDATSESAAGAFAQLMLPRTFMTASTRPAFSLASPLTRTSLNNIKTILAQNFDHEQNQFDAAERHAAVMVPLCNVNDRPGILLEVRSSKLRTHSGEVRCDILEI